MTVDSDGGHGNIGTESNTFLNWHGGDGYNFKNANTPYVGERGEGWRFQLQAGALLFPDLPMSSCQEA